MDLRILGCFLTIEGSERTPSLLKCFSSKKMMESIIRLRDRSNELYRKLSGTSLGQLSRIMYLYINSSWNSAFVKK